MEIQKLFNVLVMGGALVAAKSSIAIDEDTDQPCFCSATAECVIDNNGVKKVKDGFFCCWGTSVNDVQ